MAASQALIDLVETDPFLGLDPLTEWLRDHPELIERVLPVIIGSTGEFMRLMRVYPQAGHELRRMAREVGLSKMGLHDGRAF